MGHLAALPVAIPLIGAAFIIAIKSFTPRLVHDALGASAALAVTAICAILLAHTGHGPIVYWLGGWHPHRGVAIGISLSIDGIGAGLATMVSALVVAALLYSWRYFRAVDGLFHGLMLVFLGAMCGFCLTGDLFNLFVFFELMSVAAYALAAYKIEEKAPIEGAINFAVTNSVAAFAILIGISMLYARTGALNMAQIGKALALHPPDALVVVAMALIVLGLLTKAAAVPVHFWLADAHAVAPIPVCVLFSGVMVELAVYAVARVYWTMFAVPFEPHGADFRAILVTLGVVTALVGAVTCFLQRHLKRLLALSTVSHVGLFVIGVGLLTDRGLSGSATYVVGHGFVKGALFMCAGILLNRFGSIDEHDLHGRGREERAVGVLWVVGALALAAVPMVTPFFGKSLLDESAIGVHWGWLAAVFIVASAMTGGAVLRVAGRVFAGFGPKLPEDSQAREAEEEDAEVETLDRTPWLMVALPAALLAAALVLGLVPGLVPSIEHAASHLRDHGAYVRAVLHGQAAHYLEPPKSHLKGSDFASGAISVAGAIAVAGAALFGRGLGERLPEALLRPVVAPVRALRTAHSGHVGDYIAWWTAGLAVFGGVCLLALTGCGATPPQAPKRDAHEVSSALNAVSGACGKAEEIRAFESLGPHRADLEREALTGAAPLRAVYHRNTAWVFQDKTIEQLLKLAVSDLRQCGLTGTARKLESQVR